MGRNLGNCVGRGMVRSAAVAAGPTSASCAAATTTGASSAAPAAATSICRARGTTRVGACRVGAVTRGTRAGRRGVALDRHRAA